eukprot:7030252-Heterocapsa_arctica.AAC.1
MHVQLQCRNAAPLLRPTPPEVNPLSAAAGSAWDASHYMSSWVSSYVAECGVDGFPESEVKLGGVATHR